MKNRRSLSPSTNVIARGVHATRRGGARHEVSARVTLKAPSGEVFHGWALNVSRGGIRMILEETVELGREFEVTLSTGADPPSACIGRVVWLQQEQDGIVCGIELRGVFAVRKAPGR